MKSAEHERPSAWSILTPAIMFTGGSILMFLGAINHNLEEVYVALYLEAASAVMLVGLLIMQHYGLFGRS